jgi:acyl-CoA thioesterase-1
VKIFIVFGCALLVGCGGGTRPDSSAKPAEAPAPAAPASHDEDNRPAIVAFGDSLTAGFGADPGHSYPDFLQKEIDALGLRWRVVNAGVSGDTTTDGLARVGEVLVYKPRIVILEFGGNDGLRGLPVRTTHANLERMIVELRKAGAQIVLAGMTLPPNYGPDYIRSFEDVYKNLSAKYKLPLIPFLLNGVGGNPKLMQADGIHPTGAGNRIVAHNVMKVLEPLLNSSR